MIFFYAHALFEYTFTKNGKKKIEEVVKNLFLKPDNRTSMVRPCIINLHLYLKKNIFIESKCIMAIDLSESFTYI